MEWDEDRARQPPSRSPGGDRTGGRADRPLRGGDRACCRRTRRWSWSSLRPRKSGASLVAGDDADEVGFFALGPVCRGRSRSRRTAASWRGFRASWGFASSRGKAGTMAPGARPRCCCPAAAAPSRTSSTASARPPAAGDRRGGLQPRRGARGRGGPGGRPAAGHLPPPGLPRYRRAQCGDQRLAGSAQPQIDRAGRLPVLCPAPPAVFTGPVVNIHPALLPKYGGQGYYGDRSTRPCWRPATRDRLHRPPGRRPVRHGPHPGAAPVPVLPGDDVHPRRPRLRRRMRALPAGARPVGPPDSGWTISPLITAMKSPPACGPRGFPFHGRAAGPDQPGRFPQTPLPSPSVSAGSPQAR